MFARLKTVLNSLQGPSIEEMEHRYLEGAVSRIDLERRERDVDAGLFRRPARYY